MERSDVVDIAVECIEVRKDNPNTMTDRELSMLKENILEQGGVYPTLIVTPVEDSWDEDEGEYGRFELLDGAQRLQAIVSLGYEDATCEIWSGLEEEEKLILLNTLNELRGTNDPDKAKKLLEKTYKAISEDNFLARLPQGLSFHTFYTQQTATSGKAAAPTTSTGVRSRPSKAASGRTGKIYTLELPVSFIDSAETALSMGEAVAEAEGKIKKGVRPRNVAWQIILQFFLEKAPTELDYDFEDVDEEEEEVKAPPKTKPASKSKSKSKTKKKKKK